MAKLVVFGAMLTCNKGLAPTSLIVSSQTNTMGGYVPAATIMDFAPLTNIPTFGMCTTQSNPAVAAATSAAGGTPTPAPCVPVTAAPWSSGAPKTKIGNFPALTAGCTCTCAYGGTIEVSYPGQTSIDVE